MHHLKETTIDGVKFVLIPELLHDRLALMVMSHQTTSVQARIIASEWKEYDPEVFSVK